MCVSEFTSDPTFQSLDLMWWMCLERQTSKLLIENWGSVEMMLLIFSLSFLTQSRRGVHGSLGHCEQRARRWEREQQRGQSSIVLTGHTNRVEEHGGQVEVRRTSWARGVKWGWKMDITGPLNVWKRATIFHPYHKKNPKLWLIMKLVKAWRRRNQPLEPVPFLHSIDQTVPRLFVSQHKPTNPPTRAQLINRGGNCVYSCLSWPLNHLRWRFHPLPFISNTNI